MFGDPKEIFIMFLIIGIASLIPVLIAGYYYFKAINKWEKEYKNKPQEIIITIRNENNLKNPNERSEPKF